MLSSAQLKEAFDKYDKDQSGHFEMEEVVKLATSLGAKASKRDLEDLFRSIDVNFDNKLSFNEFLAWYRVGKHSKLSNLLKYQMQFEKGINKAGQYLNQMARPGE
jgi:Ca2+-binding EF-hand superfamily protein